MPPTIIPLTAMPWGVLQTFLSKPYRCNYHYIVVVASMALTRSLYPEKNAWAQKLCKRWYKKSPRCGQAITCIGESECCYLNHVLQSFFYFSSAEQTPNVPPWIQPVGKTKGVLSHLHSPERRSRHTTLTKKCLHLCQGLGIPYDAIHLIGGSVHRLKPCFFFSVFCVFCL